MSNAVIRLRLTFRNSLYASAVVRGHYVIFSHIPWPHIRPNMSFPGGTSAVQRRRHLPARTETAKYEDRWVSLPRDTSTDYFNVVYSRATGSRLGSRLTNFGLPWGGLGGVQKLTPRFLRFVVKMHSNIVCCSLAHSDVVGTISSPHSVHHLRGDHGCGAMVSYLKQPGLR